MRIKILPCWLVSFIYFILLTCHSARFICAADLPTSLSFKHLMTGDGDSVGEVLSFYQDKFGFMWIGGKLGLARYNGKEFTFFRNQPNNPDSISGNTINDIIEDSKGQLWVATTSGLNRFDYETEKFEHFFHNPSNINTISSNDIYRLRIDNNKNFWLTTREGLNRFDEATHRIIRYPREGDNAELFTAYTMDIASNGNGIFYIATGYGLKRWDSQSGKITHYQSNRKLPNTLPVDLIRSILVDTQQRVWVGSEKGLVQFMPDTGDFIFYPTDMDAQGSTISAAIWDILEDRKGNIWVATDGQGLAYIDEQSKKLITSVHHNLSTDSINSNQVRRVYENRVGDIWSGTFPGGVNIFEPYRAGFRVHKNTGDDHKSISASNVRSFYLDSQGRLLIGTDGGGINYFDASSQSYNVMRNQPGKLNSISSDDIITMGEDAQHNIWVGTWNTGVTVFNDKTGAYKHYDADSNNPHALSNTHTWKILKTRDNTVWVATIGSGLNKYVPELDGFKHYLKSSKASSPIADDLVWALCEDSQSNLWVGTENGLSRYNKSTDSFTNYYADASKAGSISNNKIISLYVDSKARLWVGTHQGGLNLYDDKTDSFSAVTLEDGLLSNVVNAIVEDNEGNIWMSSDKGLTRYNPERRDLRNFTKDDGIQTGEFNVGAVIKAPSGELLFGGTHGLTRFLPKKIQTNTVVPPVVITEVSVMNKLSVIGAKDSALKKASYLTKEISLKHTQNIFSIGFAALNFRNSAKNQYAYQLEGFNEDWTFVGNESKTSYTNLNPGTYVFKVKAANNDGIWNQNATEMVIRVLPSWWNTPWAYAMYCLVIVSLAWAYVDNIHRTNRRLETSVRMRTQDLEEANKKLEELTLSDALTKLGNRRLLEKTIVSDTYAVDRAYENWRKSGSKIPLTNNDLIFTMIDIDHFKDINDVYGHAAGDKILIQVALTLQELARKTDYIIRWGGEEFVIVSKYTDRAEASVLANRFLEAVAATTFSVGDNMTLSLTCSLGYACYPLNKEHLQHYSWEAMINVADYGLYTAKKSGRNCWLGFESTDTLATSVEEIKQNARLRKIEFKTSLPTLSKVRWA
jgi:diguanylate cyclase (GGDEF)-like protein